jgi:site-specific DNA-cytosine methylase
MLEESLAQKPTLKWNTVRGAWEKIGTENLLCGHLELFSQTWQTSGMTVNGLVYELPMQEPLTTVSESSSSPTLATPKARDWSPEGYEAGLRRGTPQLGTQIKALGNGVYDIPEDSMLRTPSAIEGQGGAISEKKSREKNRMLQVRDQMAQLAAENGLKVSDAIAKDLLPTPALGHIRNYDEPVEDYLARRKKMEDGEYRGMPGVSLGVALRMELFPTPNTMEHREIKTPEQIAELKAKSPGGYRNLRESVINDLLPTPIVRDYKDGSAPQSRDGKVSTDTVARAVFNSGEVTDMSWGKFEPAIRRWEEVIHRSAPEPTKPDGKENSHRLSSRFTEWMMGVPDGWITDVGLSRVDELKACGNGVVPQQAELALKVLLQGVTSLNDIE